ncbi:MAG: hypothetical protein DSY47_03630 [Hydrogenothermus sp.]|nr:MAG: hypothetical protein DSY47_03630 [Hydrogenothermus sp.]
MKFINKDKIFKVENIPIVLTVSIFVSISLFEAFLILFLLYELYLFFRRNLSIKGIFSIPIFLLMFASITSTALYGKLKDLAGALEQTFFLIIYFLKNKIPTSYELFKKLNIAVISIATIDALVVFYNTFVHGKPKPIWGGIFEIGNAFSLASVSALVMFFVEKDKRLKFLYMILFLIFSGLIFFSAKRSSLIGFSFVIFVLLVKLFKFSKISKKWLVISLTSIFIVFSTGITYTFYKFPKYKTVFKIISFDKTLTEEELNRFSSNRWYIGKQGVLALEKDIEEKNLLPIIIGHGYNSGYYLDPPSPVGRTYESIIFISELIHKGIIGLFAMLLMMFLYFRFVFKIKIPEFKHIIALPFLAYPAYFLMASIFTNFWDAFLPVCFLLFGLAENYYKSLLEA